MSYKPKYRSIDTPAITATVAITAGQLITATGVPADADATDVIGVAATGAEPGSELAYWRGGTQRLTATGTLTPGALVKAAAAGTVTAYTPGTDDPEMLLGIALADTGAGLWEVNLTR